MLVGRAVAGALGVVIDMLLVSRALGVTVRTQLVENHRTFAAALALIAAAMATMSEWPSATSLQMLVAMVVTASLAGAVAYLATSFALWQMGGKPVGPEAELSGGGWCRVEDDLVRSPCLRESKMKEVLAAIMRLSAALP